MVLIILLFIFALTTLQAREIAPFDNGLNDIESLEGKAKFLKELGYTGTTWRPGNTIGMLNALDEEGLKLYATYVVLQANMNGCPIPGAYVDEINALKGRDTIVWLTIRGETTDVIALTAIREVADLADANGLRVALYPHYGFHVDTVATSMRFAKAINQSHVGVSFNLCHFLKQNDEEDLEKTIRSAGSKLFLVSINGADSGATKEMDWDQLIQPLGEGSFDTKKVMELLNKVRYQGPILLQCYNIDQADKKHLTASMRSWQATK